MPYIDRKAITPNRVKLTKYNNEDGTAKYYNSKYWYRLRNYHIANNPLCVDCAKNGITRAADEVHHIVSFLWFTEQRDRWTALLDSDNLVSLCNSCHKERHRHLYRPNNFEETEYYKKIHNL